MVALDFFISIDYAQNTLLDNINLKQGWIGMTRYCHLEVTPLRPFNDDAETLKMVVDEVGVGDIISDVNHVVVSSRVVVTATTANTANDNNAATAAAASNDNDNSTAAEEESEDVNDPATATVDDAATTAEKKLV